MNNMEDILKTLKQKRLKKKIRSYGYNLERLNDMNRHIQYWILSLQEANTKAGKNYCYTMIKMYLKRYQFYLNK